MDFDFYTWNENLFIYLKKNKIHFYDYILLSKEFPTRQTNHKSHFDFQLIWNAVALS